ncbi:MrcB family domain-containing protein [Paenibacillus sp. MBLB4367]|uniref:MrcB family domain-containing protein n=1 Tax=Paenibacillus sp. MBLB4367 TaxID=3384767 RepID=UPI003908186F
MALPIQLQDIFKIKQKSYKMVVILSLLEEQAISSKNEVSLPSVRERFLAHYRKREMEGKTGDQPPGNLKNWEKIYGGQLKMIMMTPFQVLENILEINSPNQTVGFKDQLWREMNPIVIEELRLYAQTELKNYYANLKSSVSLRTYIEQIFTQYKQAKQEPFAKHPLGKLVRQTIPQEIKSLPFIDSNHKVQGSVGKGNWADIPWIAILDKRITETTQRGEYIVYLFSEDMTTVYLTLAQGVTVPKQDGKRAAYEYLKRKVQELRGLLPLENMQKDENIFLTSSSGLGRDYQVSTIAYVKYEHDNLPDNERMIEDLQNFVENYKLYTRTLDDLVSELNPDDTSSIEEEQEPVDMRPVSEIIQSIKSHIQNKGFTYPEHLIENFYLSLKTKPFVILAGISGTGKTKLVKLFADALGATEANKQFTLIPVRPDWSDPSDLIGYKDLSNVFRPGKLTEVLVEASKRENSSKPFFICLDEMNLARVEHYFSDMLSILETQRWVDGRIETDTVVPQEILGTAAGLGYNKSVIIPDNVFIIGTVNMDETTHPFSKKVLDRANTLEFNYINLQDYPELNAEAEPETLGQVPSSFLRADYLNLQEAYANYTEISKRTTEKLVKINDILEEIHSHIGFRVRDAVCFYMIYNQRFGLMPEERAFDLQLLQKILPRIQGSSQSVKRVLVELMLMCLGLKKNVEELVNDASELYKPWRRYADAPQAVYPQSARKIAYMLRRLEDDGFTSFWIS